MSYYNIDSADGNAITQGIQSEVEARRAARRMANERGESVYLYEVGGGDGESEVDSEEIEPEVAATYQIEARAPGTATHRASAWDSHLVGQGVFATRGEAEAAIVELRALGDEWATAEYRVVEVA